MPVRQELSMIDRYEILLGFHWTQNAVIHFDLVKFDLVLLFCGSLSDWSPD